MSRFERSLSELIPYDDPAHPDYAARKALERRKALEDYDSETDADKERERSEGVE